jgi:hypothetical protein
MSSSEKPLHAFAINLLAGVRLALLRPLPTAVFRVGATQIVLLVALALAMTLGLGYLHVDAPRRFNEYGLASFAARFFVNFFAAYLVARLARSLDDFPLFLVAVLSTVPANIALDELYRLLWRPELVAEHPVLGWSPTVLVFAWGFGVVYLAARRVFQRGRLRSAGATVAYYAVVLGWSLTLPATNFWYTDARPESNPLAKIDVESVYYSQPSLLEKQLTELKPQRKGVHDIYFVAVGGWANQDVFLKEARSSRRLFDERFDTKGRSVILANNPQTVGELPLANAPNLSAALKSIGALMDPAEDVLFLFLTSHGSREHELAMNFWPLRPNDIVPQQLRDILDDAGIQWRVVVVSACYSGGFIKPLSDARTLVMTAAAADRTSFGCSNENDFTYFGKALFDEALRQEISFVKAFDEAKRRITERESAEKLKPSRPQIAVGERIPEFFAPLERRLAALNGPSLQAAAGCDKAAETPPEGDVSCSEPVGLDTPHR